MNTMWDVSFSLSFSFAFSAIVLHFLQIHSEYCVLHLKLFTIDAEQCIKCIQFLYYFSIVSCFLRSLQCKIYAFLTDTKMKTRSFCLAMQPNYRNYVRPRKQRLNNRTSAKRCKMENSNCKTVALLLSLDIHSQLSIVCNGVCMLH